MGLFDFFKNKKDKQQPNSADEKTAPSIYDKMSKYRAYVVLFMKMQQQPNYAPIAAYEKPNGELIGFLYALGEDTSYDMAATEVVENMKSRFEKQLQEKEILSYVVLYHSPYYDINNPKVAQTDEELRAIAILYNFGDGEQGALGLPYKFQEEQVMYRGIAAFTEEENNDLFNTSIEEGKDYFQDREAIVAPTYESKAGISVTKANTLSLHHTWGGIFGFERYNSPEGEQLAQAYFSLAVDRGVTAQQENLSFFDLDYEDVTFRVIAVGNQLTTMLPIVQTDYSLDFETKSIQEWENIQNLEAIVSGSGRDTFGLWFFATDYAENKSLYQNQKNLQVNISGIVFVLDIHLPEERAATEEAPGFSDDFTAYMPSKSLPNFACFDFIGQLEDFRPTTVLENEQLEGYMLNMRLITKEDQRDFFTIDLYVAKENMRIKTLEKGMKLTGMFQMQGRIAASAPVKEE